MVWRVRRVPLVLLIAAIWLGFTQSVWWFLSNPLIVAWWIPAVPNLDLADDRLAYLSMIGGFILLQYCRPSRGVITAEAAAAPYLCALEVRVM